MTRWCSHYSNNGHNSRTCPIHVGSSSSSPSLYGGGSVKLFGVRLTDGSIIKKSTSMGNLSCAVAHYNSSSQNLDSPSSDPLHDRVHIPSGYFRRFRLRIRIGLLAGQNVEVLSSSPKSPTSFLSEHHVKALAGGKAPTTGIATRHVRRSHSGKLVRVKKDAGLWWSCNDEFSSTTHLDKGNSFSQQRA
ncbi:hypothetical protein ACFX2H_013064 [Malus domestica]